MASTKPTCTGSASWLAQARASFSRASAAPRRLHTAAWKGFAAERKIERSIDVAAPRDQLPINVDYCERPVMDRLDQARADLLGQQFRTAIRRGRVAPPNSIL